MELNIKFNEEILVEMANRVLDEYEYKGKTIREWADLIAHPKTNYERIISKTPEELAEWLWFKVGKCPPFDVCPSQCIPCEAKDCWLDWLKQEVEEDG